jgi:hypothetical protein
VIASVIAVVVVQVIALWLFESGVHVHGDARGRVGRFRRDAHTVRGRTSGRGGEMPDGEFVLSRDRRDAIMRAVKAIERQLEEMARKPGWQALYVISTNLAIIQTNVTSMPRVSSN